MWNEIKRLILKEPPCVGIDIGSASLKLAEVGRSGRPYLKKFAAVETPPGALEDGRVADSKVLADGLERLVAASGTDSRHAVVAVGGRNVTARKLSLPAMAPEELREAIKWDVERQIPYPPGSYFYDYTLTGRSRTEGEISVTIFAVPYDVLNALTAAVKGAGLKPVAIDAEPLALQRTCPRADNAAFVDIGRLHAQITIFQDDLPAVIRTVPLGGEKIAGKQAEETLGELASDVNRTIEYYTAQNKDAYVDKIILAGGGALIADATAALARNFAVPAVVIDPFQTVDIPPSFAGAGLRRAGAKYGVALGLAMRGGD